MSTNTPLDVPGAVQPAHIPVMGMGDTALGPQNEATASANVNFEISENAEQVVSPSIEAELLFAHSVGALSSNAFPLGYAEASLAAVDRLPKGEHDAVHGIPEAQMSVSHFDGTVAAAAAQAVFQDALGADGVWSGGTGSVGADARARAAGLEGERRIGVRRGKSTRPRKNIDFSSGGFFSDELSDEDMEFKEERGDDEYDPDAEDEPQKKRGRPRLPEPTNGEPRRKRGRPRKYPLEATGTQQGPTLSSEADGEPKIKRKRGRPRKYRPEEDPALVGQVPAPNAEGKPGNEGSDEVDLGPIIMSNLTEASIDPNLDPSLYLNTDASV